MIVPVFVLVCACALGVHTEQSKYLEGRSEIYKAWTTLKTTLLSIDGNIPNLRDPRRHYAEIYNVIQDVAIPESGCVNAAYIVIYHEVLNSSAPDGINHPQRVVDRVKELIINIHKRINKVEELIDNVCKNNSENCDDQVDEHLRDSSDVGSRHFYRLVVRAASALNALNERLIEVTNYLVGHQFLVKEGITLEHVVLSLANVYRELHSPKLLC